MTYLPPDETPCARNPCGINAQCRELVKAGSCSCIPEYYGDPYVACRPECMMNSECPISLACINMKCKDPCPGVCGSNAICNAVNHSPMCSCITGYRGNPFESCNRESKVWLFVSSSSCNVTDFPLSLERRTHHRSLSAITVWFKRSMPKNQQCSSLFLLTKLFRQPSKLPSWMYR